MLTSSPYQCEIDGIHYDILFSSSIPFAAYSGRGMMMMQSTVSVGFDLTTKTTATPYKIEGDLVIINNQRFVMSLSGDLYEIRSDGFIGERLGN